MNAPSFQRELVEFDLGHRVLTAAPVHSFVGGDRVFAEWPLFCKRVGFALPVGPSEVETPRLVGWSREGDFEVWTIELPGRFNDSGSGAPREAIPGLLLASRRGAQAVHGHQPGPAVLEVVVSYRRWPRLLRLHPGGCPGDRLRVLVGQVVDGAPALWDLKTHPHGLIVGQTNSGKSEAARMLIAQLRRKKFRVSVFTPKLGDPVLADVVDVGDFISGSDLETLQRVADFLTEAREDITIREALMAEHGVKTWSEMPGEVQVELPLRLFVFDETRFWFVPDGDSKEVTELKKIIAARWRFLVQAGRSAGHHGLALTQSPEVDALGGGFAARQLGMRLAIRSLDSTFYAKVFPHSVADLSLLSNGATPPGRAIGRGLIAPETRFGTSDVQDAPLQVAFLDREGASAFIAGRDDYFPGRVLAGVGVGS